MVLGKHSGRHALGLRCSELGFRIDGHVLEQVYADFLELADLVKVVGDHHIVELVSRHGHVRFDRKSNPDYGLPLPYLPDVALDCGEMDQLSSPSQRNDSEQQEDYLWGV
jgi:hypothetical protein